MTEYLEKFIQMLRSEKYYSAHTCSNYRRDLKLFQSHLLGQGIKSWAKVGYADVSAFAASRHRQGRKSRTIQRELSSIRSFYQFLIQHAIVAKNPALEVSAPKPDKPLPKICDAETIDRLLQLNDDSDPLLVRDIAIFELIYSS